MLWVLRAWAFIEGPLKDCTKSQKQINSKSRPQGRAHTGYTFSAVVPARPRGCKSSCSKTMYCIYHITTLQRWFKSTECLAVCCPIVSNTLLADLLKYIVILLLTCALLDQLIDAAPSASAVFCTQNGDGCTVAVLKSLWGSRWKQGGEVFKLRWRVTTVQRSTACHASQGRIVSRMMSKNIFENHPE